MGLEGEKTVPSTRKTIQFLIQKPEMSEIKSYASHLPEESKANFGRRYGKLLELLNVKVQVGAITALAQYYDSTLRCFTFPNFQLAPTLEEFALILGQPLTGRPYHYRGNYPSVEKVVKALGVDSVWWTNKDTRGLSVKGMSRSLLKEVMKKLVQEKRWETLTDVLALAIYDLILFPSSGDLVGPAAMDVFMARKCRGENSAYPVLADVYYTLSFCHEQKGRRIMCCLPVLYVWLTAHMLRRKNSSFCPISELTNMESRTYSDKEWRQMFMELSEESVRWYPLATGVVQILVSCGEFPNVPLMGTLGCINYNPTLALRQLRYPLMGPPAAELLVPFMANLKDEVMLEKIRKAWKNVTYKAGELGKRSCGATAAYKEWVRNRVEVIKLPFQTSAPNMLQETDTVVEESEEVKILKGKLAKSENEKEALELELIEARSTLEALKTEYNGKARSLEQASKRARIEKDSGNKVQNHLSSANQDLRKQIAECHGVRNENEQLRRVLKESEQQVNALKAQVSEQASQHERDRRVDEQACLEVIRGYRERFEAEHMKVEDLLKGREEVLEENWKLKGEVVNLEAAHAEAQRHLFDLDLKMRETIARYEERIEKDRDEVRGVISIYRSTIDRKNEELRSLGNWSVERNHFLGLIREMRESYTYAWYEVGRWARKLGNIERIPELVRDAEVMINPLTTPREAIELIDVCKGLVEDFEELVIEARGNLQEAEEEQ